MDLCCSGWRFSLYFPDIEKITKLELDASLLLIYTTSCSWGIWAAEVGLGRKWKLEVGARVIKRWAVDLVTCESTPHRPEACNCCTAVMSGINEEAKYMWKWFDLKSTPLRGIIYPTYAIFFGGPCDMWKYSTPPGGLQLLRQSRRNGNWENS